MPSGFKQLKSDAEKNIRVILQASFSKLDLVSREEFVVAIAVLPEGESLTIYSGKRHLTLKPKDIEHYVGERGRRGSKLPRGFQRVDDISADDPESSEE